MFREAVAEMLKKEPDMDVVGACGSASEALEMLRGDVRPTMILLDFDLGPDRVVDFIRDAREMGFGGHILVVTAGITGQEAIQLIESGIRGIVHKHNTPATLCHTIRRVASGDVFLEGSYLKTVFRNIDRTRHGGTSLTERDRIVLRCMLQGLANKEIAGRLHLSEGAVKASISQLFHKLKVRTRAQLVKVALEEYRDQL